MTLPNSNSPLDSNVSSSGFNSPAQMGLAEVLQMCCLSRRSGQITFRSGESCGYVFVQQGRVLHAMCGVIEGEEAIYLMLSWPSGGFSMDEDILPHKKTITLTWEQLLFEGAHRADVGMMSGRSPSTIPVVTAEPVTSSRARESQPKLLVTFPGEAPVVYELEAEYTHVGRAPGNEIVLPHSSISSRHCIFILSGPDIVLRDLNSSNGTFLNSHAINEAILLPGDIVQVGAVEMKFEPGMKRPKLNSNVSTPRPAVAPEKSESLVRSLKRSTTKINVGQGQTAGGTPAMDNSVYVKGESAISYRDLAVPEQKKKHPWLFMGIGIGVSLAVIGGFYYYFFMLH